VRWTVWAGQLVWRSVCTLLEMWYLVLLKDFFSKYRWQWRNFLIPMFASCYGLRDVGQRNANILQHSNCRSKLLLNILIQCYFINLTDLRLLTSHSMTSCPTTWRLYRDHWLLWRHLNRSSYINFVKLKHFALVGHISLLFLFSFPTLSHDLDLWQTIHILVHDYLKA